MNSVAKREPTDEEIYYGQLQSLQQEKLLSHWETLTLKQKRCLGLQIEQIDRELFFKQCQEIRHRHQPASSYQPFRNYCFSGNDRDLHAGKKRVQAGKIGVVVLAGGQGSRIQCTGPKGCCAVTNVQNKSLFQFLAEKVLAASRDIGSALPMAIMTSPLNHLQIQTFFTQHGFFGLHPTQVSFFYQEMWPLLTLNGDLFLEDVDQIAFGPNGNGGFFKTFVESGLWEKWDRQGIECVNIIPIDNPLADPFDYELFGFQERVDSEVVIKAALKRDPLENVGVLTEIDGKAAIVEYFEMAENDRLNRNEKGELKYGIANLGLYAITMSFVKKISQKKLPLHRAKKRARVWENQQILFPQEPNAWKFEEFIFDAFSFTSKVTSLLYPRERCFAPLKNLSGQDSIEEIHKALLANDYSVFQKITGSKVPGHPIFELSPQFYYPTSELLSKWKGKPFPNEDYIHD